MPKISELPEAEAVTFDEDVVVQQAGVTRRVPLALCQGPAGGGAENFADLGGAPGDNPALAAALALKAPLSNPAFTDEPTAPTPGAGNNTTRLATTAFVATALANLINAAPGALDTLDELAAALGDDANFAATITAALALKAPLDSPAFTGVPTAPTAAGGTNTTQLATTAFVQAALAGLINAAPGVLDTLDELAAALGDDANFAATMTAALAGKQAANAMLGFLAALADPNADSIPFWDDSAGALAWGSLGAGLGWNGTALELAGWTQIGATANPNGVASFDFASIPATYNDLMVVFLGISHNNGSNAQGNIAISEDNVNFSATATITGSGPASDTFYGSILIPGYRLGAGLLKSNTASLTTSPSIGTSGQDREWRSDTPIQALRFGWSAGNFDGGQAKLFGK